MQEKQVVIDEDQEESQFPGQKMSARQVVIDEDQEESQFPGQKMPARRLGQYHLGQRWQLHLLQSFDIGIVVRYGDIDIDGDIEIVVKYGDIDIADTDSTTFRDFCFNSALIPHNQLGILDKSK